MDSVTKMAVLPMPVFERLAKYDPNYSSVKNLIDTDIKKDIVLNKRTNLMGQLFSYNLNQQKLDNEKRHLYGQTPFPIPKIPKKPEPTMQQSQAPTHQEDDEDEFFDSSTEIQTDPPAQTVETPDEPVETENADVVEEETNHVEPAVDADQGTDSMDESKVAEPPAELDISLASQEKYANIKAMQRLIDKRVPRQYMFTDDQGQLHLDGELVEGTNINAILNFITTPGTNYVRGATTVLHTLLKLPDFDQGFVKNERAYKNYVQRFGETLPEPFTEEELQGYGGGRVAGRRKVQADVFIVIDKLPCNFV